MDYTVVLFLSFFCDLFDHNSVTVSQLQLQSEEEHDLFSQRQALACDELPQPCSLLVGLLYNLGLILIVGAIIPIRTAEASSDQIRSIKHQYSNVSVKGISCYS